MKRLFTPLAVGAAAWLLVACGGGDAPDASTTNSAQASAQRAGSSSYRVAAPEGLAATRLDARLRSARGPVNVWVSLEQNSVAAQRVALIEAAGLTGTDRATIQSAAPLRAGVKDHRARVAETQSALAGQLSALGGKELARVQNAHNAIAVRIDAAQLSQVAALQGVAKVRPVVNYKLDLSETVPYVGGSAVQAAGFDGTGVRVAVLDSGIDYTHKNLGGAGTQAAYEAAYGTEPASAQNKSRDGLFPTDKVIGGSDFVGEDWPNTPEAPDDDPIDFEGHGTHVSDIIAGRSLDGTHKGMAPGAKLYAVKVCSAVATACSGIALLQGMDFALDPNGDGDLSDAVDVVNMSLGQDYGQIEDDLTLASSNAVKLGVVVVASAGNGSNMPYKVGSPSTAPGVISVAQTQVPSAVAIPLVINSPAAIAGVYSNTETVSWAPIGSGVTGDVVYVGRACPGDTLLANPFGKIALIDRGSCSVSLKVDQAAAAGATGTLIGLVAAGDPISFSNGGGTHFVPTLVITLADKTKIKGQLSAGQAVNVSLTTAAGIPLVGGMAGSSSRGPSMAFQTIKPEIGAPGASMSAEVGTGTGETAFGGTSGAAPMVSGAAALLVQAFPNRTPLQIKAMLMNSAETTVFTNQALLPGGLAPITRIGGGELRVNRALALNTIAYNRDSRSAALSFGAVEASEPIVLKQTLTVENLSRSTRTYTVTPTFRYADDQASGAVKVLTRSRISVSGRERESLEVTLVIDPNKLPAWDLNGGSLGGRGDLLNGPEYDGYITLTSGSEKLSVPWHVLPRKAAANDAQLEDSRSGPVVKLRNRGLDAGEFEVFSLTGQSTKLPRPTPGGPGTAGSNEAVIDLRSVGVRYWADDDLIEFAISTNGRRVHPAYPGGFEVDIDTNGDGVPDFAVYNSELGAFGSSGQTVVNVLNLVTGKGSIFFFADADLNSGNIILTAPASFMGIVPGKTISFDVLAIDNYFSGNVSDSIVGMRFTPGSERFATVEGFTGTVPRLSRANLQVVANPVADTASTERGLLLMYRRNAGSEADAIRIR